MPLQTYTKRYRANPIRQKGPRSHRTGKVISPWKRYAPVAFLLLGLFFLGNALWPILSYELFTSPTLRAAASSDENAPRGMSLFNREYLLPTPKPAPIVMSQDADYSDLSNWFPKDVSAALGTEQSKRYLLTIPSVGIVDAQVVIGGTNLDHNLIQYPGTADPGEFGAPVIFGHSVLRQFYDPREQNPRRYTSIFSTIMTLKIGDKIIIKNDGVVYNYKVVNKTEVKPEDTYILEQHHDVRELKLVTCVPEGTFLRRGVVSAQLEDLR